jgi:hypothetical protein
LSPSLAVALRVREGGGRLIRLGANLGIARVWVRRELGIDAK